MPVGNKEILFPYLTRLQSMQICQRGGTQENNIDYIYYKGNHSEVEKEDSLALGMHWALSSSSKDPIYRFYYFDKRFLRFHVTVRPVGSWLRVLKGL